MIYNHMSMSMVGSHLVYQIHTIIMIMIYIYDRFNIIYHISISILVPNQCMNPHTLRQLNRTHLRQREIIWLVKVFLLFVTRCLSRAFFHVQYNLLQITALALVCPKINHPQTHQTQKNTEDCSYNRDRWFVLKGPAL